MGIFFLLVEKQKKDVNWGTDIYVQLFGQFLVIAKAKATGKSKFYAEDELHAGVEEEKQNKEAGEEEKEKEKEGRKDKERTVKINILKIFAQWGRPAQ